MARYCSLLLALIGAVVTAFLAGCVSQSGWRRFDPVAADAAALADAP